MATIERRPGAPTHRRLALLVVVACLAASLSLRGAAALGARRVLAQAPAIRETHHSGKLWTGSPLFAASEIAKAGFECGYEGRDCNWVYSDRTGPNGECVDPKIPPIPGNLNPTIAEFCAFQQTTPVAYWDGVYRNRTLLTETIPNGPMFGCIIGSNWQSNEARRLPGWAGKGFDANSGRFSNLVSVGAWQDTAAYPGRFFPTYSQEGGLGWMLDYSVRTGIPLIGGVADFLVNNLLPGQYIRNFGGFKDEVREILPGIWLGRVYSLPLSLSWDLSVGNVSPFTVFTQVHFLLFQGCLGAASQGA